MLVDDRKELEARYELAVETQSVLQQTVARLSGIVAIAADAIVSLDEQQRITLFNDGAETIFGYTRDEAMGQPLSMLLPEKFRASHGDHIRSFANADVSARRMGERGEILGRRKNGETFFAEASISKIDVGGNRIYTAVLRDITERREAAQQLQQSKKVLEIALAVGQIGTFELDHVTGGLVWARYRASYEGQSSEYTIAFKQIGSGWRIYDVIDGGHSTRAFLTTHVACLRAARTDTAAELCSAP